PGARRVDVVVGGGVDDHRASPTRVRGPAGPPADDRSGAAAARASGGTEKKPTIMPAPIRLHETREWRASATRRLRAVMIASAPSGSVSQARSGAHDPR